MAKTNSNHVNNGNFGAYGLTKAQAERTVTFRVLLLVVFDIAASFFFDYIINAPGEVELKFYQETRPVLLWVTIALFALSLIYVAAAKFTKLKTAKHIVTPEMLAAMTFITMSAVVFYNNFRLTPFLFYTMIVVISILAAIYYIYTMLFY